MSADDDLRTLRATVSALRLKHGIREDRPIVLGDIHDTPSTPFSNGMTEVCVGSCLLYEGGPHVLLTVDQLEGRDLEIALTPDAAIALSVHLIASAVEFKRAARKR